MGDACQYEFLHVSRDGEILSRARSSDCNDVDIYPAEAVQLHCSATLIESEIHAGEISFFIAAGEVFRKTSLYNPYTTSGRDEDYSRNVALDFKEQISAYADDTTLVYSGDMPPRYVEQLLTPERLARGFELIRGVGDSPLVKYDGTGLYFVDFKPSGEVSVEILPDCEWLRSPVTGGMMLDTNGEAPVSDDPPYSSPQEYYAIARKYQKQVSNRYITDVEHVMTLAAPEFTE